MLFRSSQWYASKKQLGKIITLAKKLNKQYPDNDSVTTFLIQAYLLNKKFTEAEVSLNSIVASNPNDVKHRLLLADLLSKRSTAENNRTNQALGLLNEAIKIEPGNMSIYVFKAALLIKQENYKEALLVAKLTQNKFSDSSTGQLLEADIYRTQKQYDKALPFISKSISNSRIKKYCQPWWIS